MWLAPAYPHHAGERKSILDAGEQMLLEFGGVNELSGRRNTNIPEIWGDES
jgi:hypothetical protein